MRHPEPAASHLFPALHLDRPRRRSRHDKPLSPCEETRSTDGGRCSHRGGIEAEHAGKDGQAEQKTPSCSVHRKAPGTGVDRGISTAASRSFWWCGRRPRTSSSTPFSSSISWLEFNRDLNRDLPPDSSQRDWLCLVLWPIQERVLNCSPRNTCRNSASRRRYRCAGDVCRV